MSMVCSFCKMKTALKLSKSGLEQEILSYEFESWNWNRVYCSLQATQIWLNQKWGSNDQISPMVSQFCQFVRL